MLVSQSLHLFWRVMRSLIRQPIWVVMLLVQPMFWLLLYSQLFRRVVDLGGFGTTSYVDFLAPGIAIMTAFFSGTWSGMGTIEDLDRGVVERFLATPAHRSAIIAGRILQSAATAMIQVVIILLVALALGATNGGVLGWLVILVASGLVAGGFAGISNGLALLTRQEATMIALANFIGLPLLFFSSILIAVELIPGWMQDLSLANPVEWSVRASREVALGGAAWGSVGAFLGLLLLFVAATGAFATWAFRSYQRTL